jgi:hypothetical protein|nr:MAG TPA: Rz lysis protein [Caudoviricetes sp.]
MLTNLLTNKVTVYVLAGVVIATFAGVTGGYIVNRHWQGKWNEEMLRQQKEIVKHKTEVRNMERKSVEAVAKIDEEKTAQLKEARDEIDTLRSKLSNGTIRLRSCPATAVQVRTTEVSTSSGVDNRPQTQQDDDNQRIGQHILNIAEQANIAIGQRDACVAILKADREIGTQNDTDK